ncbi:MAG TPA: hypothetical protein DIC18_04560 [Clostridiales bacterium]|nr:hypothetical protein [Clostridiales bacterium]
MAKPFKIKTQDIAVAGIFLSFILVFMLVPFNTFGVNMAFIPLIAVCLAATVKGFWMGLAMGIAFGVASLVGSYIHPDLTAPMFHNPVVSVLPRVFIPITVHFSFKFVKWLLRNKRDDLSTGAASVVSTVIGVCTNTLLVLATWAIFYFGRTFTFEGNSLTITGAFLVSVISSNFIAELIICAVITPVICTAVRIALGIDRKGAPIAEHASAATPLEEVTALPQEQEDEGGSFEKEQRADVEKTSEDTEEKQ